MPQKTMYLTADMPTSKFLPSESALQEMLDLTYMRPVHAARFDPTIGKTDWTAQERGEYWGHFPPVGVDRYLVVADAFDGVNALHHYEPPFGLREYDTRFNAPVATLEASAE